MIVTDRNSIPKFNPAFTAVGCFMLHDGKMLLLRRNLHKPQGGTWGIPGGKTNIAEPISYALRRETKEETGVTLSLFRYLGVVDVRYPEYDFVYHMFGVALKECPSITFRADEHDTLQWAGVDEALKLPLIQDMDTCIERFRGDLSYLRP